MAQTIRTEIHCAKCGKQLSSTVTVVDPQAIHAAEQDAWEKGCYTPDAGWLCHADYEKHINPLDDITREQDFGYEVTYGLTVSIRTARKAHTCSGLPRMVGKAPAQAVRLGSPPRRDVAQ